MPSRRQTPLAAAARTSRRPSKGRQQNGSRAGDAIAIASYLGASDRFDRALALFAETYANQNERDYQALKDAVSDGRIKAETGL